MKYLSWQSIFELSAPVRIMGKVYLKTRRSRSIYQYCKINANATGFRLVSDNSKMLKQVDDGCLYMRQTLMHMDDPIVCLGKTKRYTRQYRKFLHFGRNTLIKHLKFNFILCGYSGFSREVKKFKTHREKMVFFVFILTMGRESIDSQKS